MCVCLCICVCVGLCVISQVISLFSNKISIDYVTYMKGEMERSEHLHLINTTGGGEGSI